MTPIGSSLRSAARAVAVRLIFGVLLFAGLAAAVLSQPDKRLTDFDQSFYLTIAYDLIHHSTFSNGVFDKVDSTRATPPPGMFFTPLYPLVVAAAAKADPRFGATLDCTIEANEKHRRLDSCEIYARPVLLVHAAFLAVGVIAIALTAEMIFSGAAVFYLAGALAAVGIGSEAVLLSYLMTESLSFCLFSLFGCALVRGLKHTRWHDWMVAGLMAGVATLARPTYLLLIPIGLVLLAITLWRPRRIADWPATTLRSAAASAAAFAIAAALVLAPWLARNALSLDKAGFTEEYGAAAMIERLAFNTMTGREFALAFPYCVPTLGPLTVNGLAGKDAMARFEWDSHDSFFEQGRARREALVAQYGRLDPVIGGLLATEMKRDWWRHLGTSVALSWCGLWVSGLWGVVLLPIFTLALWQARRRAPLLLFYAAPALALVGVHGLLANHYPRYNLGLIGPIAVGAAWIVIETWRWAGDVPARRGTARPG